MPSGDVLECCWMKLETERRRLLMHETFELHSRVHTAGGIMRVAEQQQRTSRSLLRQRFREPIEIELEPVLAVRNAIGPDLALTDDVNCNWNVQQTLDWAPALRDKADLLWLEEPIPPDNTPGMARVAHGTSIPVATGERLTTKYEFADLLRAIQSELAENVSGDALA